VKSRKMRVVNFFTDDRQLKALRRHARTLEDGRASVAAVIRQAIDEFLVRHAGARPSAKMREWQLGLSGKVGRGKTPPRIMLHLRDRKRLELVRLQAQALKGTHRTAGRVIRAAIDEYLAAHAEERREALREKRLKLGDESFLTWKRRVERGPTGEEKPPRRRSRSGARRVS